MKRGRGKDVNRRAASLRGGRLTVSDFLTCPVPRWEDILAFLTAVFACLLPF